MKGRTNGCGHYGAERAFLQQQPLSSPKENKTVTVGTNFTSSVLRSSLLLQ
jgi:hypothetical protein